MTTVVYGCYRDLAVGGFLFDTREATSPLPYTQATLSRLDEEHLTKQRSPVSGYSCVVWRRVASWESFPKAYPKLNKKG